MEYGVFHGSGGLTRLIEDFARSICIPPLELKLSGELQDALCISVRKRIDLAEGRWRRDGGCGTAEDGMIEDVEGFDVQFEGDALPDGEYAVNRCIEVPERLVLNEIAWRVTESTDRRGGKGATIEPLCAGSR